MKKRKLQIDVIGPEEGGINLIRCKFYYSGNTYLFWTTKTNYEALLSEKFFIRDGKTKDCAGVINTTNMFSEEK